MDVWPVHRVARRARRRLLLNVQRTSSVAERSYAGRLDAGKNFPPSVRSMPTVGVASIARVNFSDAADSGAVETRVFVTTQTGRRLMAIWKEPPTKKDAPTMTPEPVLKRE